MLIFCLMLWSLFTLQCTTSQSIDIGGVWEVQCPNGCTCQVLPFYDLPLHQWTNARHVKTEDLQKHPLENELLKTATCVASDDTESLLNNLPSELQVLTILESGNGQNEIPLRAVNFQKFTNLLSLDIQGIRNDESSKIDQLKHNKDQGAIVLSADSLLPLGSTLLFLNLERITLTSISLTNKTKPNLVVKPANNPNDENAVFNMTNKNGHRLILLSQSNNGESVDKEILPYDIYKQEVEGNRYHGGLFAGLGALTHMRVYDCALKDISWHMFDGLDNLLHLSLEKNNLMFIPEFCFYGTPSLKFLSLANNQLLTLKSVDLAGLLMLEEIDLSGNNLTFLSELSFPPFPALQVADLRDNPLELVFPSTFEIMNTTVQLHLGGGGETRLALQKNALLGLRRLKVLHLNNLHIPLLERFILQGIPNLLELKMQGNITVIDFDAFLDLKKLESLTLSHCRLREISMDAFYGLESVERIDLSYNDLEFIPPGLFNVQQQMKLKEIILSKNRLTTLPIDFFRNLRLSNKQLQVQNVRLDGNPWDCTCSMTTWNPHLVSRAKETAPRCFTPKRLLNWGVFHALRKGRLQCKRVKRHRNSARVNNAVFTSDNNII